MANASNFLVKETNKALAPVVRYILGASLFAVALVACYPVTQFPNAYEPQFIAIIFGLPSACIGLFMLLASDVHLKLSRTSLFLAGLCCAVFAGREAYLDGTFSIPWWVGCLACLIVAALFSDNSAQSNEEPAFVGRFDDLSEKSSPQPKSEISFRGEQIFPRSATAS